MTARGEHRRDSASAVVPPETGSVPATRAFLVALLRGWAVREEAIDEAALLATEIVTNAVVHGAGAVTLEVRVQDGGVHVAVTDHGAPGPEHLVPREPTAEGEHGRGLWLVQALARDWGTTTHESPAATTVWFELAVLS